MWKRLCRAGALGLLAGALFSADAYAEDLLDRIKAKGEIVIGTEGRYPPFEYIEDGKIVGYSTDILNEIMAGLPDVKVNRLDVPFSGILAGLEAQKFDFVVTSVTATRERDQRYALTLPIADATTAFVKRKGDDRIKSPQDVGGLVIASQTGAAQLVEAEKLSQQLGKNGGKSASEVRAYSDYNESYADLGVGRIDAVANTLPSLLYLAKTRSDVFEMVPGTFGSKYYFAWVGRKDEDSRRLVDLFNEGIARLNKSGKLAELQEKWFGFTMEVPADSLPLPPA